MKSKIGTMYIKMKGTRYLYEQFISNLMILATPGQHSCNTRTTVPTTPGQAFLKHADIHS